MKLNEYETKKIEMNNFSCIMITLENGNEVSITIDGSGNIKTSSCYSELSMKPIASNSVIIQCVDAKIPKQRCKYLNNNYVTKISKGCIENGKCISCRYKNVNKIIYKEE